MYNYTSRCISHYQHSDVCSLIGNLFFTSAFVVCYDIGYFQSALCLGFGCLLPRLFLKLGFRGVFGSLLLRIRRVKSRKRYLGGKKVYLYERLRVEISSRFKGVVEPFLEQDLKMDVESREDRLIITLHRKPS